MLACHLEHAGVITVIVAHVIDDCVVVIKGLQDARIAAVIAVSKLSAYVRVRRFEAVDKKRDFCVSGEVGQKLFAVVGNPGRLRVQWAEVRQFHKKLLVVSSQ